MSAMIVVIGAGYSGLTAAAVLASQGIPVTVLEAHAMPGGCAGMFRTGPYTFDVGATTFSAVQPHQPVGKLMQTLGMEFDLVKQDPGMIIRLTDGDVVRHADPHVWTETMAERFPHGDQRGFWKQMYRTEQRVWDLIGGLPAFPPSTLHEVVKLAQRWKDASLLPLMLRSVASIMHAHNIPTHGPVASLIDELLLISTQSTSATAPALTGAMGLTYPSETYYPMGGMYRGAVQLMRYIRAHGGEVIVRERVTQIDPQGAGYIVQTHSGKVFRADKVASTLPIWNLASIATGDLQRYAQRKARTRSAWTAITVYFSLDRQPHLPTTYYQIHLDKPIDGVHASSLFVTISPPNDHRKAPEGQATVTVSTHGRAEDWEGLDQPTYDARKLAVQQAIMQTLERRMPELDGIGRHHLTSGTPHTWITYTHRHRGYVGGVPHTIRQPLLTMPPQRTPFRGFYHLGDTSFPGQGVPAIMYGAQQAAYLCMHE